VRRLLVANRGEIARRIFRTCREMGIATVAVYSSADAASPHVLEADEAVLLPGDRPADTYLRGDLIVAAALRVGADVVHPGYGFLSENSDFAAACVAAGLTWVGPPVSAIEAMGSKLGAKALMSSAGVPTLPSVDATGLSVAEMTEAAAGVGWPLLVKASFGGGGRGMRIVSSPDELVESVESARREAASAFGDDTVFLERYLVGARHVEIQIFGDTQGNVVHLFERECSIQRRHQKVVEESPSVAVTPALRSAMGSAAVAAGKSIGYVGAGTVEFLLAADGSFYFLEVNTRLQVEHPVTEMVTGLDLVRLQLLVASGAPMPPVPAHDGHAIEVRLYAEDPAHGYQPTTGVLHRFSAPLSAGLRVDSGVEDGSVVGVHYDPMLAKVIGWAPSRAEAAARLASGLVAMHIHGVTTNRDFLVGVLRSSDFLAGETDTGFLERHDPADLVAAGRSAFVDRFHAVAAALAVQADNRSSAVVLTAAPSGWRNSRSADQRLSLSVADGRVMVVDYRLGRSPGVAVDGSPVDVGVVVAASPTLVDMVIDGVRRRYDVHLVDFSVFVDSPLGSSAFEVVDRLPVATVHVPHGSLLAPMPGTVVRADVAVGDAVAPGDTLVVLEAMKMEHPIRAPQAGVVTEVDVVAGQVVDNGQVLVVLSDDA
jgi:acetyl/propionyl-CoA carboxylase alpha subunit